MPLILANVDEEYEVTNYMGMPALFKVDEHLEEIGLYIGAKVKIISKIKSGLIVQVGQTRLAIDEKTAVKVIVK